MINVQQAGFLGAAPKQVSGGFGNSFLRIGKLLTGNTRTCLIACSAIYP